MRRYRVGSKYHTVFDPDDPIPSDVTVVPHWKTAEQYDWVRTDDDCVMQVLRVGSLKRPRGTVKRIGYIGTCTGTYLTGKNCKMDSSRRLNIYSFSGENTNVIDRKKLNTREKLFVNFIIAGIDIRDAYLKAFPTNNPGFAYSQAARLVSTERIKTAMKEELKPVLEGLDIDEKFILKKIKEVILHSPKDDTRLKALFKLADIMDMEDKTRTSTTTLAVGAFKGFSDAAIEGAQRPKEIGNGK